MFQFLKRIRQVVLNEGDLNLDSTVELAKEIPQLYVEPELNIQSDDTVSQQDIDLPKYIIKEDTEIMSIPCDHKNILPQTLLKIDKKLITNPDQVAIFINLSHLNSIDTVEEGYKEIIDIKDPCGGTGYIKGEILIEKVVLIAGVHYSVLLFDSVTQNKVYDGDVEYLTAYQNYAVLPFGEEPVIDPTKVTAVFTTALTRLDDIAGLDYYLYTVDGEVKLEVLP